MKYKTPAGPLFPRFRPVTGAMLVCAGGASWLNAVDWAGCYARYGLPLCVVDHALFSQQLSLIPPWIVPLMMFHHAVCHTGVSAKRNMYRYPSRGAFWRMRCRDALAEALTGSAAILAGSLLPGLCREAPLPMINWSGAHTVFSLMTGAPLPVPVSPVPVLAGFWAATCLQILTFLLLYSVLECLFRPFSAFVAVLLSDLAFCSPLQSTVWDRASLHYGCWTRPFGVAALLAGWLAVAAGLYLLGHAACRRVDAL